MSNTQILPNFTIVYNTQTKEKPGFIGTAWEFFHDQKIAEERKEELIKKGKFPTLRPYFHSRDAAHLGASDRYWIEMQMEKHHG